MGKLKCHRSIMVNVALYAMRFATGPKLPRGLSFLVWEGDPRGGQGKKLALVIWLFYRIVNHELFLVHNSNFES